MELENTLNNLGLSARQAKIYISCLQCGEASVLALARGSGLKRPSVYVLLDELEARGLVTRVQRGKKTLYRAESPKRIVSELSEKLTRAQEVLPSLEAIYNVNPDKPTIRIAEGVLEVQGIYNTLFTYLRHNPQEELLIFGSLRDALENFQTSVIDYFYEAMCVSHNPIREIGNDDSETRQYFRRSRKINPLHELRLIREGRFFQTDNMLYGNTLVIFSVKKEIFAVIIESVGIADTYRTLFNMAWRSGKTL